MKLRPKRCCWNSRPSGPVYAVSGSGGLPTARLPARWAGNPRPPRLHKDGARGAPAYDGARRSRCSRSVTSDSRSSVVRPATWQTPAISVGISRRRGFLLHRTERHIADPSSIKTGRSIADLSQSGRSATVTEGRSPLEGHGGGSRCQAAATTIGNPPALSPALRALSRAGPELGQGVAAGRVPRTAPPPCS